MLNIVVPIAGRGSRFANPELLLPKPLTPIHGDPLVAMVVRNITPRAPHRFVFLALRDHLREYPLKETLERVARGCLIVPVEEVTDGIACTALLARDLIDSSDPLMLVSSDHWVDVGIDDYLEEMACADADGQIMTMTSTNPKWFFVGLDDRRRVSRVVEKAPISSEAAVGVYNFRRGRDFVKAADRMIGRNFRVDNEFGIAPAYNEMIRDASRIAIYNIGPEGVGMCSLGTAADLDRFLANPISRRAAGIAA